MTQPSIPTLPASPPALVVSLHDVSPHTQSDCDTILCEFAQLGVHRASLLVIPDHHRRGHIADDPGFGEWLHAQAASGHEIVMHGYYHQRARRTDESMSDRFTTRLYTADEGEFYDIDRASASALVEKSRGEFQQLGFAPTGFIAPAWLLSAEAEDAIRDLHVDYTTRLSTVLDLKTGRTFASQSLVWSVRSGWRRWTSLRWNSFLHGRLATNPLLRISIHPVDLHHPRIWQQIRELAARALADREPVTYHEWVSRQRAAHP